MDLEDSTSIGLLGGAGRGSRSVFTRFAISRYPTKVGSNILPEFVLNHDRAGIGSEYGSVMFGEKEGEGEAVVLVDGDVWGKGEEMKGEEGDVVRKSSAT